MASLTLIGTTHNTPVQNILKRVPEDDYDYVFSEQIAGMGRPALKHVFNMLLAPIGAVLLVAYQIVRLISQQFSLPGFLPFVSHTDAAACNTISRTTDAEQVNMDAPIFAHFERRPPMADILLDWMTVVLGAYLVLELRSVPDLLLVIGAIYLPWRMFAYLYRTGFRDRYMADRIRETLDADETGITIVGAGHVPGLYYHLSKNGIDVETTMTPNYNV